MYTLDKFSVEIEKRDGTGNVVLTAYGKGDTPEEAFKAAVSSIASALSRSDDPEGEGI